MEHNKVLGQSPLHAFLYSQNSVSIYECTRLTQTAVIFSWMMTPEPFSLEEYEMTHQIKEALHTLAL